MPSPAAATKSLLFKQIANLRLSNQQLSHSQFTNPAELVHWMAAMQAQDNEMAKWGIATRLPGIKKEQVEAALDKGSILRTHILRPTWHIVSAKDIHWMLTLTAPQIRRQMSSNERLLGLTDAVFKKSNRIIEKALAKGEHLTREEIITLLAKANIPRQEFRSSHLMMRAELDGLVCSGATKNNKQTYALLDLRVPKKKDLSKQEALQTLADRYFTSHGPATLKDFIWWSGLLVADAKFALESIKGTLLSETIVTNTYWLKDPGSTISKINPTAHLLPAFDEFIISYKDRTATVAQEHHTKTFTVNGIFKPLLLVNDSITGIWKRTFTKNSIVIELQGFKPHSAATLNMIKQAAKRLQKYYGKKVEIK